MINYRLLDDSIRFYEKDGFKRIESPWTVSLPVSQITAPKGASDWLIKDKNKCLVASGEQSFLYLYLKGFLPKGCFQTVTPCFRDESFDSTHTKYFMKNELIVTDLPLGDPESIIVNLMSTATSFFYNMFGIFPEAVETEIGYDLVYQGTEIGSYGYRECDFLKWVYGTGIAEPRTSSLMYKYGIPYKGYT